MRAQRLTALCILTVLWSYGTGSAQGACFDRSSCVGCENPILYTFECCLGSVLEKQSPNQYAGYVLSYFNQSQLPINRTFSITTQPAAAAFYVASNGTVWTNQSLDVRNTSCWIAVMTSTLQYVIVAVGVIDINDSPPQLIGLPTTKSTPAANVLAGLCFTVVDTDFGANGNLSTVQIAGGDSAGLFSVTIVRSPALQACVTNRVPIDGRNVSTFNLTIVATDQGSPPLSSATWLAVQLTDVNYFAPVFRPLPPLRPLQDNTPPGTVVLSFVATDNDTGVNGKVTYSMSMVPAGPFPFALNMTTGNLTLSGPLPSGMGFLQYYLCVSATDSSVDFPLSSVVCINISVVPSAPPSLTDKLSLLPACPVGINETMLDAFVTKLYASIKYPTRVRCDILQGTDNFSATGSVLADIFVCEVKANGYLVFEKASQLNITVGITWNIPLPLDTSSLLALYSNSTCTVNVIDSDDNVPKLSQTLFAFTEKQPLGSYVAQLIGYNPDVGENRVIVYSLIRVTNATADLTSMNLFDLDQRTGQLTTQAIIDRNVVGKKLTLTVSLTYTDLPLVKNVTTVLLDVIGAVTFPANGYTFTLFKGVSPPAVVGRVEAAVDNLQNISFSYSLLKNSSQFAVDHLGNVSALVPFSTVEVYQFEVVARPSANPPVPNTVTVKVSVQDICGNARSLALQLPASVGQSVGMALTAAGIGDILLNYRTPESAFFDINPSSGVVTVKATPPGEQWNSSYNISFVVYNSRFPDVATRCILMVSVTPANLALIIGIITGPCAALVIIIMVCLLALSTFRCVKKRNSLSIAARARRESIHLSDLNGESRIPSPKGILNPIASPGGVSSKSNGSVKFKYTAEEYLVNRQDRVANAETTIKQYPSVKFGASGDSPETAPRTKDGDPDPSSMVVLSSFGSSEPPQSSVVQPLALLMPASRSHESHEGSLLLHSHPPTSSSHFLPRPIKPLPPTHEDMLDHTLATNAGRARLSDVNSCDGESTYSDSTSIRNTSIPRFQHGVAQPTVAARYVPCPAGRSSSPPSFLPPPPARVVPAALPTFSHHPYHRSSSPPQHCTSSADTRSSPPLREHPSVSMGPQMVPQRGPPAASYPEVMPSAFDHPDLSERLSPTQSCDSASLDQELRFTQDDLGRDFYNLTYNDIDDASDL